MSLTVKFETHLKESGVSGKTLRNYRADLVHFLRWAKTHLGQRDINVSSLEDLLPHFSELVISYRDYHKELDVPQSTTNRRLSTLRNLSKFLVCESFLEDNPMKTISNVRYEPTQEEKIQAMIAEFAKHLKEEGVTHTTSKNYLSDVRHFVAWLASQEDWTKEQEVQSS